MAAYSARAVDRSVPGNGPLLNVKDGGIAPIRRVLNAAASTSVTCPNLHTAAGSVRAITNEMLIQRDGSTVFRGPIVRDESVWENDGRDEVTFQCRGLEWYFDKLNIGRTDRTNYLLNPDFESGTANWTAVGVTFTTDSARRKTGTNSAKLVQANKGTDTFIEQAVTINGGGVGAVVIFAVWYFIESTGWVGPALDSRGIHLERRSTAGALNEFRVEEIDDDTARGVWLRGEVSVHVPAGLTETVKARLYGVGTTGGIRYDSASLTVMESLSYYSTDQATIAAGIVAHLQSTTYGKFDLGIATSTPASGILRDRHYQFAEHPHGGRALAEFPALDNGFDYEVDESTRTFHTHYPRRGRLQAPITIADIVKARYVHLDGDAASNSITCLGEGDGPDREEGGATDLAAFGGPVLEDIIGPFPGTDIDALDSRAIEDLRLKKAPRLLELTLRPGYRLFDLYPGDTCTVTIDHGYLQVSGLWRVIEWTLDPTPDLLTVVCNPA